VSHLLSPKTVSREELYQKVWSTPMRKLAQDYNVSDVAIAKACKRLNVPRPHRGYWAQLKVGKGVTRPKLPALSADKPTSTVIDATRCGTISNLFEIERPTLSPVEIPTDLRRCDPLVSATRRAIESAKSCKDHLVRTIGSGILDVTATKSSLHRALCLMEALIRASALRGWKVECGENRATHVVIGEDSVSLSLSERIQRTEIQPQPNEKWYVRRYTYAATGRLVLQLNDYLGNRTRATWSDGKVQRLEAMLPQVIRGLEIASQRRRELRLERIERERKWAEERRLREDLAKRVRTEKERRARLESEAAAWQRAAGIRQLSDELERRARVTPDSFESDATSRWLQWARAIAATHDPFENGYITQAIEHVDLDANLDCSRDVPVW
jgi:hypothetical protein